MNVSEEDFKRRYAELSDDGLLSLDREDLVDIARRCYDEELERRGIEIKQNILQEREMEIVPPPPNYAGATGRTITANPVAGINLGRYKIPILIAGALASLAWVVYQQYALRADRLYQEAAGAAGGTEEMVAAVKRLAAIHGGRSTAQLLDLAMNRKPLDLGGDVQIAAIQALGDRREASATLARLLQPQAVEPLRKAVADALQKMECDEHCVGSVLHYLERTSAGEANVEERVLEASVAKSGPSSDWESIRAETKREERAVYESLYVVLQRQDALTVRALERIYGLGTDAPSKFALDLLSKIRLRDACPALLQTKEAIKSGLATGQDEVEATIRAVGCQ
ncbi:MAG TPA: hypothetical protein VFW44_03305 [Bryobacteraceae bacterium]|nr:hypothetical protein [Bryobacteraceae bacterium]